MGSQAGSILYINYEEDNLRWYVCLNSTGPNICTVLVDPITSTPTNAHGGKSSARSVKTGDTHNDSNKRDNPLLMSIRPKM